MVHSGGGGRGSGRWSKAPLTPTLPPLEACCSGQPKGFVRLGPACPAQHPGLGYVSVAPCYRLMSAGQRGGRGRAETRITVPSAEARQHRARGVAGPRAYLSCPLCCLTGSPSEAGSRLAVSPCPPTRAGDRACRHPGSQMGHRICQVAGTSPTRLPWLLRALPSCFGPFL